jgi:hypothetical protein
MNFSYSRNMFNKSFSKCFFKNKLSFNLLYSNLNRKKFCVGFLNKSYSTNIALLCNSDTIRSNMLPGSINGFNGTMIPSECGNTDEAGLMSVLNSHGYNIFNFQIIYYLKESILLANTVR